MSKLQARAFSPWTLRRVSRLKGGCSQNWLPRVHSNNMVRLWWLAVSGVLSAAPALMPMPAKVETKSGSLAIDGGFSISTLGCADARMPRAALRITGRIARQTGVPIRGGGATLQVECGPD